MLEHNDICFASSLMDKCIPFLSKTFFIFRQYSYNQTSIRFRGSFFPFFSLQDYIIMSNTWNVVDVKERNLLFLCSCHDF